MPSIANKPGPSTRPAQAQPKSQAEKDKKRSAAKRQLHHARRKRQGEEERSLQALQLAVDTFDPASAETFSDFPLSLPTQRGLRKASYTTPTAIQSRTLLHSLRGRDVLGSACTGSGKTLAFLLPILELLWRRKWGPQDGLGALVISPTRELAMQIFDVLRAVGAAHAFSAGLVIGGKNVRDESERLARMNILVATPGRLLQHMDQTAGFDVDHLQILVLDEADRILDMGFARTLNAIVSALPRSRQTLLFSATQTQSVQDLARLSLQSPEHVAVREEGHEGATPRNLEQHYLVCALERKLDVLYSFIKSHLKIKGLVFMSSCKQVRFVYEAFRKLQPGIPLLHLHGKQKQSKRLDIFQRFTSASHALLLATDIASRGLDFPAVDWVVQLDAPEDAETYIHRVGRTARYESRGRALLMLCPSEEEGMMRALEAKQVSVQRIKVKESKTQSVQQMLQSFCFQDPEMKYLGQKAFVSYLRSVHLHKNKAIFDLHALPLKAYAASLGLPGAPRVRFLKGQAEEAKRRKNAVREGTGMGKGDDHGEDDVEEAEEGDEADLSDASSEGPEEEEPTDLRAAQLSSAPSQSPAPGEPDPKSKSAVRTKYDRMFERKNQGILSAHYAALVDHAVDGDLNDDEDFITLKRVDHALDGDGADGAARAHADELREQELSKRKLRIGASRKAMLRYKPLGSKLTFDDAGVGHADYELEDDSKFRAGDVRAAGREYAERERGALGVVDGADKDVAREKRRERKRRRKEREGDGEGAEGAVAVIAPLEEAVVEDGYVSPDFGFIGDGSGDESAQERPRKKRRTGKGRRREERESGSEVDELAEQERLALRLLQGGM